MGETPIRISFVTPAHNEALNLPRLVKQVDEVLRGHTESFEIIVVNDCSTDASREVLERLKQEIPSLRAIHRDGPPGVGLATRAGLQAAGGQIILTMDADLQNRPEEIPRLLEALNDCDMVCGSRYLPGGSSGHVLRRTVLSRVVNGVYQWLLGMPVKDLSHGFRAFRRGAVEQLTLRSRHFGIYIEIPIKAHAAGYRLREVPVTQDGREGGRSKFRLLRQLPEYLSIFAYGLLARLRPRKTRGS